MTRANASVAGLAAVRDAAHRLQVAAETGIACAPVRDLIGDDPALAYAVQAVGIARHVSRGARITGRKVGLTSEAVQRQLGVDQPDFGVLLDSMAVAADATVPIGLLQPRVEAELAFVLKDDLLEPGLSAADVRTAIAYATAAIEIVDSRISDWDITFTDTVADNGSSGRYVLADDRLEIDSFAPRDVGMSMSIDGVVVSTGTGAACLGDPLEALAWLARTAVRLGDPLLAGQVVLSGALGPMVAVKPGAQVRADLTLDGAPLSSVAIAFADTEEKP
ncbi:2-keto-4-pentenoate hydratase [Kibdelosporangium banguiense]|uniref:2-keto-4-pentenoate hydratase n=1 Tax=Kibdelosporangium banguiense TaxID=1365924 RepID=A0ABS4T7M4_9PSEU|nr:fumarylacetoacetate hydrolase family protein [Kibdelosporangium banguiense]MBP2320417.1 2-keto-4-pentenoate hydratase [Kibdelosporangium banguiense]